MSSEPESVRKQKGSIQDPNDCTGPAEMADNVAAEDQSECKFIFVVAIDFGTTFTGYAYSTKDNYKEITVNRFKGNKICSAKAPTKALFDRDQNFCAFGYAAEEKYKELVEDEENEDWYYFERFKMSLYRTRNLKRDVKLKDKTGKEMKALDVFSAVIKHLKNNFEEQQNAAKAGHESDDILWVLTVPAIWSDSAKQFMHEAAIMAEIDDDHLMIVLEPEAASLYCKSEHFARTTKLDKSTVYEAFPAGHRYIIADLGGGTVDLAVHEILDDGNLKEVRRSDGDAYGGTLVDKNFFELLDDIFGKNVINALKRECTEKYIELEEEFETKKQTLNLKPEDILRIKYPADTIASLLKIKNCSIDDIEKSVQEKYADEIKLKKNKIHMSIRKLFELFDSALEGIIKLIEGLRTHQGETVVDTLVLVGGLSDSKYIQTYIEKKMRSEGVRTFIPAESYLAVLKGAVLMGHRPRTITERIARFTYGFAVSSSFKEGVHPESLKIYKRERYLCKSVFKKCITIGQTLKQGEQFEVRSSHITETVSDMFDCVYSALYKSTKEDPEVCTEESCERVGYFIHYPPPDGWPIYSRFLDVMVVGETELTFFSINSEGQLKTVKTDFL